MSTIDRLDYSKPPPGYRCWPIGGIGPNASEILFHDLSGWRDRGGSTTVPGKAAGWSDEADCRAAAWAHYKRYNDPPGMVVQWFQGREGGEWTASNAQGLVYTRCHAIRKEGRPEASAAAWACRGVLADKVNAQILDSRYVAVDGPIWPTVLTWSDKQVDEVDRWLVDSTAEMPEVLRG